RRSPQISSPQKERVGTPVGADGEPPGGGTADGTRRPIKPFPDSVNQTAESGPFTTPVGALDAVGGVNSVYAPPVVIRPTLFPLPSPKYKAPSGPTAINKGCPLTLNSVNEPPVVKRPIFGMFASVNQRAPSGPVTIPKGLPPTVGTVNSVIVPEVVIRPIRPAASVNQSAPSGPAVIRRAPLPAEGSGNSVITPEGVILPMLLPRLSANQRFPSGPAAIPCGMLPPVGIGNSVKTPPVVRRPTLLPTALNSTNQRLPS